MLPVIPADAAPMVVLPALAAVATPVVVIVATLGLDEDQVTEAVRSWVLPSLYVPVALYWILDPTFAD